MRTQRCLTIENMAFVDHRTYTIPYIHLKKSKLDLHGDNLL